MRIFVAALLVLGAGCTRHNPNSAAADLSVGALDMSMGGAPDLTVVGDLAGCHSAADCPPGRACNPATGVCSTSCAGGLMCRGGCCDGINCVAGDGDAACGRGGGACAMCSGATPACSGGTCVALCSVGSGNMCGAGSCCSADNVCAPIAGNACGMSGQGCIDCTRAAQGQSCGTGTCGCATAADCPFGTSCNTTSHACEPACGAGHTACNGGCCNGATCVPGTGGDACATGNAMCTSCVGNSNGSACVFVPGGPNRCGCDSAADCGDQHACNVMMHACTTACSPTQPCKGGCCDNGTCVPGTADAKCGALGGACINCATASTGHVCQAGRFCGCSNPGASSDCPIGSNCDNATHLCATTCSNVVGCTGSCCPNVTVNAVCAPPTPVTCGTSGTCGDCTASPLGHACVGGTGCGCNTSADCPSGQACNQATQTCGTACNANRPCNGGCCSNGTCAAGTANDACGSPGAVCRDCTNSPRGHVCAAGRCGCVAAADCPDGTSCNTTTHVCEADCGGGNHTACNTGCCDDARGFCTPGTADWACGATGGTCSVCSGGTPRCNGVACAP